MITRLKAMMRANVVPWVLAMSIASLLVVPVVPVISHPGFSQWLIPAAKANPVSFIRDLAQRTGLYRTPQKATAPTGRRSGGAGRGPICALAKGQSPQSIKALMPFEAISNSATDQPNQPNEPDTEYVGALTLAAQPTFWFYVPYVLDAKADADSQQKRVAQFVLLDEANRPLLKELITFDLLEKARLVEYALPYALETDQLYKWYFSVVCDADKLSRNPIVRGWVERVEPTPALQEALSETLKVEWYQAYANNGIWLEAIDGLINTRRNFPTAYLEDWLALLEELELSEVNQFEIPREAGPIDREV